ncbi:MAG: hypothetical protein A3B10_04310 [Candidatus Doudnabacteria bacterium RIFCSPLOWO2_01_FULL_44_21]|uniref:SCP domain-containing protein n=1 Tax=Candidatus Doudnabacteria bacterium RIFCSPLOWO2_01_FULL_44_21 TaxID=1817841 RepID=A0A1F5PXY7_9BACT|nr:MAG: hypothetical protein A3B95_01270 [Candidatus Doudnabacteria bacterium RIFCSPHIGHO2_02_FULL_43_13b]OGE94707.1 MAG: hypothetical protein A3B10_04310 [Candidatus Doudnabacteria bacterium RIFCSPLOWO2_01_FULL_44_21]
MKNKVRFAILLASVVIFLGANSSPKLLTRVEVLKLVNQDRIMRGLPKLTENPTLTLAAYAKANDMIKANYFAHSSPAGVDPWYWLSVLGYEFTYAGENLATGFNSASDLENNWMASPTHRANILSPFYQEVGLAIIYKNNTNLVVQFFGSSVNKVTLKK